MKLAKLFRTSAGLLAVICVSGCVTTSDVKVVHDQASAAQATASQALEVAQAAQRTAQEADARSRDTQEMLNRGFKHGMRK